MGNFGSVGKEWKTPRTGREKETASPSLESVDVDDDDVGFQCLRISQHETFTSINTVHDAYA